MELRQILLISLLFLPSYQGKVCGYEVSWKSRSERVPYLQTVPCQTADCPEESLEIFRPVLSSPHSCSQVQWGRPAGWPGRPRSGWWRRNVARVGGPSGLQWPAVVRRTVSQSVRKAVQGGLAWPRGSVSLPSLSRLSQPPPPPPSLLWPRWLSSSLWSCRQPWCAWWC